jgi:hypothetical protein
LQEHFDVLSVTFNHPETKSKAVQPYGWRVTPYAYVLLKARGPEVDKIPPLRLDLDFLDTSGYVVLPIESAALPIDARSATPGQRSYQGLQLTQTLDERQSGDGKLLLEIKATARGLVPTLDELLEVKSDEFHIVKTEDQGVSVVEFDKEATDATVVSERLWTVEFAAAESATTPPKQFAFATPKVDDAELTLYRYVDADLAEVDSIVSLEQRYVAPSRRWLWISLLSLVGLIALITAVVAYRRRQPTSSEPDRFRVPERLTPFSILGLLKDVHANNGFSATERQALEKEIQQLERHFFLQPQPNTPDLDTVAKRWLSSAHRH